MMCKQVTQDAIVYVTSELVDPWSVRSGIDTIVQSRKFLTPQSMLILISRRLFAALARSCP